jgi:hypothetical protein
LTETAADLGKAKDFLLRSSMLLAQRRVNAMTL